MRLNELLTILDTCIDSLNRIKHKNITIVKQELVKERPEANYCDKCKVLFSYDSPARKGKGFFGLKLDLWTFIEDKRHEFNYTKMIMRWMWESLKKAEERVIRKPTTLNLNRPVGRPSTLGSSFGRVGSIGNSIDIANKIDTCVAIKSKPANIKGYSQTDVMMTGKLFDIVKQEKTKGYLKAPICKPYLLK